MTLLEAGVGGSDCDFLEFDWRLRSIEYLFSLIIFKIHTWMEYHLKPVGVFQGKPCVRLDTCLLLGVLWQQHRLSPVAIHINEEHTQSHSQSSFLYTIYALYSCYWNQAAFAIYESLKIRSHLDSEGSIRTSSNRRSSHQHVCSTWYQNLRVASFESEAKQDATNGNEGGYCRRLATIQ